MEQIMCRQRQVAVSIVLGVLVSVCAAVENKPAKPVKPKVVKPKASDPATKDGLSIVVRSTKVVYAQREPIALEVTLTNVSKKTFALAGATMLGWLPGRGLTFVIKDVKTGKTRILKSGTNPMIMAPVRMENKTLAPGKSVVVRTAVNQWSWSREMEGVGRWERRTKPPPARLVRKPIGAEMLPGGTYRISVLCELHKGFGRGDVTFWVGSIMSKPVEVKVDPKKVAPAPGGRPAAGGGKWTTLFAKERWYTSRKGAETSITGTLQAVPGAGGISTLQRTAYYRIGKYRLYTRARKHPALDRLVGKAVQVRGKVVEMNLEGQHLREIWPAAVRPAVIRVSPPVVPGVSKPVLPVRPKPFGPGPAPVERL